MLVHRYNIIAILLAGTHSLCCYAASLRPSKIRKDRPSSPQHGYSTLVSLLNETFDGGCNEFVTSDLWQPPTVAVSPNTLFNVVKCSGNAGYAMMAAWDGGYMNPIPRELWVVVGDSPIASRSMIQLTGDAQTKLEQVRELLQLLGDPQQPVNGSNVNPMVDETDMDERGNDIQQDGFYDEPPPQYVETPYKQLEQLVHRSYYGACARSWSGLVLEVRCTRTTAMTFETATLIAEGYASDLQPTSLKVCSKDLFDLEQESCTSVRWTKDNSRNLRHAELLVGRTWRSVD